MRRHVAAALAAVLLTSLAASAAGEAQHEYRQAIRKILADITPRHVTVEDVQFDGASVAVRGISTNVNAAANFAENVKAHPRFTPPRDISIRECEGSDPMVYEFHFVFGVKEP